MHLDPLIADKLKTGLALASFTHLGVTQNEVKKMVSDAIGQVETLLAQNQYATSMLLSVEQALNGMPNKKLTSHFRDTYEICSLIGEYRRKLEDAATAAAPSTTTIEPMGPLNLMAMAILYLRAYQQSMKLHQVGHYEIASIIAGLKSIIPLQDMEGEATLLFLEIRNKDITGIRIELDGRYYENYNWEEYDEDDVYGNQSCTIPADLAQPLIEALHCNFTRRQPPMDYQNNAR